MSDDQLMQKSLIYLNEVETVGQDILSKRYEKLELSNARNALNEAKRALEKCEARKAFIQCGGERTYMQFPKVIAIDILSEDIRSATDGINALHEEIKEKAWKLRDLEHEKKIVGVGLRPLSGAEARAIHKGFGF